MPGVSGELGTGSAGTPVPNRAVPLSGWFSKGRSIGISGTLGTASIGSVVYVPYHVIWAASLSHADIMTAYNSTVDGDTLMLPSGNVNWSSGQRWTITKALRVIGQGTSQTIINGALSGSGGSVEPSFNLVAYVPASPQSNPYFRLSAMTLSNVGYSGGVLLLRNDTAYDCTNIRLDHLNLTHTGWVFQHSGLTHGVADNCVIKGCMDIAGAGSLWSTNGYEHGTISNMYIEDSTWGPYNAVSSEIYHAGNGAARYAMRYCAITIPTGVLESPLFDQHGNQPSAYACFGAEIYENTINIGTNPYGTLMFDQRGGKSMVFNNVVSRSGSGNISLRVREEHQDADNPPALNAINGQPQHASDSHYWGNRKWGSQFDPILDNEMGVPCSTCGLNVPTENVHVWLEKQSFNGTSGIGVGLLSARPASGLTTGVRYWATDTRILYRATGPTTWVTHYTPYTYPHPHRSDPILGD